MHSDAVDRSGERADVEDLAALAAGEYFLWSWQQPIARRDQPAVAAAAISRVLSAIVPAPRSSD